MAALINILVQLLADVARCLVLQFRPTRVVEAENLFLRRQLALFKERGVKPRRVAATRLRLAVLSRLFDWRNALVVVLPKTIIRWQRAGWRLFWRLECRPGRPRIPVKLRALIRSMAQENPNRGEKRIASELLVKLGVRFSPRTVRKYMPTLPAGQPRGDQRWSTFLKNHAKAILACDFFIAVTATFRMLYVFVVIEHGSRRLKRVAVTAHLYNGGRPHGSLGPGLPGPPKTAVAIAIPSNCRHRLGQGVAVHSSSVLGGLHHEYWLVPAVE